jgi:putative FmdB family regulatory protein
MTPKMPRYRYQCEKCSEILETSHSIKERITDCKKCGEINCLKRLLAKIRYVSSNKAPAKRTSGRIVKKFIEEAKQDTKEEKQRLKNQEYEE